MVSDPWLPAGYALPGSRTAKTALFEGQGWQIYDLLPGGRALLAAEPLLCQWEEKGLVAPDQFHRFEIGGERLGVFCSGSGHLLSPLDNAPSPRDRSEAQALAISMRETRRLESSASLHDAIYVEQLSRLLPVWSLSSNEPDEIVLGTWLAGGVRVSAGAMRRLATLTRGLSMEDLRAVADLAGLRNGNATPGEGKAVDAATGKGTQPGISFEGASAAPFELPGRALLEHFFTEHVIDIVKNADRYRALGIDFPSAIALHGPPGCGKTFAVERLVEYLGWPSWSIDSTSIGSPYIHETGRKIARVFEEALRAAPAVIVIDEMESFLSDRQMGGGQGLHHVEEVAEFLRRIPEAIKARVLIIGMTNRIEMIDPAILRRGRFDHVIAVEMPEEAEVSALLERLLKDIPKAADVEPSELVRRLTRRPLSDVAFTIREGARLAARSGASAVAHTHLLAALNSLPPRTEDVEATRPIGFR